MSKSVISPYLLSLLSSGNYCLSCLGLSCCLVCVFLVAVDVVTIPLVRMTPGVSLCGDVSGLLGECLLASGLSRLLFFVRSEPLPCRHERFVSCLFFVVVVIFVGCLL